MEEVKILSISERQVEWIPKGWDRYSSKTATIRNGTITQLQVIEGYFVDADPDGAIEFFKSIKVAKAETRKD